MKKLQSFEEHINEGHINENLSEGVDIEIAGMKCVLYIRNWKDEKLSMYISNAEQKFTLEEMETLEKTLKKFKTIKSVHNMIRYSQNEPIHSGFQIKVDNLNSLLSMLLMNHLFNGKKKIK